MLSEQDSSLATDWIPLLQRPRIPASFMAQQQPFNITAGLQWEWLSKAVKACTYVCDLCFSPGMCPVVEFLCHTGVPFLVFKAPPHCSTWRLYQYTCSPSIQDCSLFSTPSPACIVCSFLDDGHSDWCEVIPYCSFDPPFLQQFVMLSIFLCASWP